jgi:hypothetical protein
VDVARSDTRSSSRRHSARGTSLGLQAAALVVGGIFVAYAARTALYILLITAVVAVCVWPLLQKRGRRGSFGMAKRIGLLCAVVSGFWICTTTAFRFADSSGTENGAGATSTVNVSPWGHDEDPSALLTSGLICALGVSALTLAAKGMGHRRA